MRRARVALALVAALGLVATACNGNGDEAAADLSGQTIEVMGIWAGAEQERFESVAAAFAEATGATVNYTSAGDDIPTVLGTRIEGGNPPDIAFIAQPALLNELAEAGSIMPIDDFAGDLVNENYTDAWVELGSSGGKLYGVWTKASNKSMIWYNTGVFEDAGVTLTTPFEEFSTAAQTISDAGVKPLSLGLADGWVASDVFENIFVRVGGADLYDQLTNHEIPWTHPKVKESLQAWRDMIGGSDGKWLAGGIEGTLQTGFDASVPKVFTDPPEAAMVFEGDFVANNIASDTEAQVGTDADFFDFPDIGGSPSSVIGSGDVAVMLKDNEASREMMRALARGQVEPWVRAGGILSPNQQVDASLYPDDITRKAATALAGAEVFKFDLSDLQPGGFGNTAGSGIWGLLQRAVEGGLTDDAIDKATADLEAQAEKAFG